MLARSMTIATTSMLLSMSVLLYYILRKRKTPTDKHQDKDAGKIESKLVHLAHMTENGSVSTHQSVTKPVIIRKQDITSEAAHLLKDSLKSSDPTVRYQALVVIQQATAFSSNFKILQESSCLDTMLALLQNSDDRSKTTDRQTLCVLQILTNMVCHPSCLSVVKDHMDRILHFACIPEYSDLVCAALQVVCNAALTSSGCRIFDNRLHQLFEMLQATDPYVLRQVLAVLVNLSCDPGSCDLILDSEVPDAFVKRVSDTLNPSTQPMILLQLVNLLNNFYKSLIPLDNDWKPQAEMKTMREFLLNSKTAIKVRVQFILFEPSITDSNQEIVHQAQSLFDLLK